MKIPSGQHLSITTHYRVTSAWHANVEPQPESQKQH